MTSTLHWASEEETLAEPRADDADLEVIDDSEGSASAWRPCFDLVYEVDVDEEDALVGDGPRRP